MRRIRLISPFLLAILLMNSSLNHAAGQPADAAQAEAEFDALFERWKELLTKMRGTVQEYRAATADQRDALRLKYERFTAEGQQMAPQLRQAAERAYRANPQRKDIADFLLELAMESSGPDPKEALRLTKLLMDSGYQNKDAVLVAGLAAFHAGDHRAAIENFERAQEQGFLNAQAKKYLDEARIRAAEGKADDLPRVKLKTSKGDVVLELFEDQAPNTVANFVSLIERDYYDGLSFHRVIDGFMAQGGCPVGDGTGGPGYRIPDEADEPDARLHFRGSLSMAKTAAPDSGGSQFFITFQATSHLDNKHTVFGRVVEGMDAVDKITRRDPMDPAAPPADRILDAEVLRKRDHEYKPETLPE